jgi:Tfp pilus assembly protein PilN
MNGTIAIKKITGFATISTKVIRGFLNPLWRILSFNLTDERIYPAKNVSISIEKGKITIAYGTRFLSKINIKAFKEIETEDEKYPQPDFLASSALVASNELGFRKTDITLSIPKAWAITKMAEFPHTVKDNLHTVLSYELDRLTPFSSEDALFDYKIISETKDKITILIIVVKKELITPYLDALKEKGLKVRNLILNLSGIETLLKLINKNKEPIFIDLDKNYYEGALFINNSIYGAFSGNFKDNDLKTKIDILSKEIEPLINTLKINEKPVSIYINLKDKDSHLKELLKANLNPAINFLNDINIPLKGITPSKTACINALSAVLNTLMPSSDKINILSNGIREQIKTPKILTIILVLIIIGLWIIYLISPLKIENKRLLEIDKEIKAKKEEVQKVEDIKKEIDNVRKEINTINEFKYNRYITLDMLKELTTIIPKNCWLTRVRFTEKNVEIEGFASSATGLLSKLESSKYFKKVEFASPTFRDLRMNADRFNIRMEIEGIQTIEKKPVQEENEFEE